MTGRCCDNVTLNRGFTSSVQRTHNTAHFFNHYTGTGAYLDTFCQVQQLLRMEKQALSAAPAYYCRHGEPAVALHPDTLSDSESFPLLAAAELSIKHTALQRREGRDKAVDRLHTLHTVIG